MVCHAECCLFWVLEETAMMYQKQSAKWCGQSTSGKYLLCRRLKVLLQLMLLPGLYVLLCLLLQRLSCLLPGIGVQLLHLLLSVLKPSQNFCDTAIAAFCSTLIDLKLLHAGGDLVNLLL